MTKRRNTRYTQALRYERWWRKNAGEMWTLPLSVQAALHKISMRRIK